MTPYYRDIPMSPADMPLLIACDLRTVRRAKTRTAKHRVWYVAVLRKLAWKVIKVTA